MDTISRFLFLVVFFFVEKAALVGLNKPYLFIKVYCLAARCGSCPCPSLPSSVIILFCSQGMDIVVSSGADASFSPSLEAGVSFLLKYWQSPTILMTRSNRQLFYTADNVSRAMAKICMTVLGLKGPARWQLMRRCCKRFVRCLLFFGGGVGNDSDFPFCHLIWRKCLETCGCALGGDGVQCFRIYIVH